MKKNAQAILDYVILLAIVIATFLLMAYYIRNSISGKIREGADTIGQGEVYGPGTTVTTTIENE
jgi:hypothetical protein